MGTDRSEIALLVLDIDGTIAGRSNTVRPPVLAAVAAARAKGIRVAIATGRMFRSARRFAEAVGADLPIISYNGAWIKDPRTDAVHWHRPVGRQLATELLDYFEQPEWRKTVSVHFYIDDKLYVRDLSPASASYATRSGIEAIAVGDLRNTLATEPTKILALSPDAAEIARVTAGLQARYSPEQLYCTRSVPTFIEACHPKVSKGEAVCFLAERMLGLTAKNVMAIGDNFNDLEMLQYVGLGVAMGSAPAAVKAAAQWVAPDVEADGAAAAISRFLL